MVKRPRARMPVCSKCDCTLDRISLVQPVRPRLSHIILESLDVDPVEVDPVEIDPIDVHPIEVDRI
jgi:hypothetical protein